MLCLYGESVWKNTADLIFQFKVPTVSDLESHISPFAIFSMLPRLSFPSDRNHWLQRSNAPVGFSRWDVQLLLSPCITRKSHDPRHSCCTRPRWIPVYEGAHFRFEKSQFQIRSIPRFGWTHHLPVRRHIGREFRLLFNVFSESACWGLSRWATG